MNESVFRFAVVLHPSLGAGAAANAAAIVIGGLRAEGFDEPLLDRDGKAHAAVRWNMPVLRAKTGGQLRTLLRDASAVPVHAVAFSAVGSGLSNSFEEYRQRVLRSRTEELDVIAVGLFGSDEEVRRLTRAFSFYA